MYANRYHQLPHSNPTILTISAAQSHHGHILEQLAPDGTRSDDEPSEIELYFTGKRLNEIKHCSLINHTKCNCNHNIPCTIFENHFLVNL